MTRVGTRAEEAFVALRADILAGRLLPGQRLQFNELTARYATSVGVLREALSRLNEQGLVISEPQQGFRVMPVSPEDLRDLTAARVEIETLVLRRSLESGDLAWESRLIAAHHVLDRTSQLDATDERLVTEEWTAAHARFHEVLLEACPVRRLRETAATLRDAAELYRRWSRHLGSEQDRDIPHEHRSLLEAALNRDIEGARRMLTQHIEFTPNAILEAGALAADSAPDALMKQAKASRAADDPGKGRPTGKRRRA